MSVKEISGINKKDTLIGLTWLQYLRTYSLRVSMYTKILLHISTTYLLRKWLSLFSTTIDDGMGYSNTQYSSLYSVQY